MWAIIVYKIKYKILKINTEKYKIYNILYKELWTDIETTIIY